MCARAALAISSETVKVNFLKRQATCYDVNGHNLKFFADLAQIIKKEKHRMIICSKQAGWLNFLTVRHFLSFFSWPFVVPLENQSWSLSESLVGQVFILNRDYLHLAIDTLTQAKSVLARRVFALLIDTLVPNVSPSVECMHYRVAANMQIIHCCVSISGRYDSIDVLSTAAWDVWIIDAGRWHRLRPDKGWSSIRGIDDGSRRRMPFLRCQL